MSGTLTDSMNTTGEKIVPASAAANEDPIAPITPRTTTIPFVMNSEHRPSLTLPRSPDSHYLPEGYSPSFRTRRERSASLQHGEGVPVLFPPTTSSFSPNTTRSRSYSLGTFPIPPPPASPRLNSSMSSFWSMDSPSVSAAPFMPSLNGPPTLTETQRAMEVALKLERIRAKEMEQAEVDLSADELRAILKKERNRMSKISADLAALKSAAVQSQAEAEVLEEGRINGLVRRMECLQQEKGRIIVELEQEEEMLTNTLQKKLDQVRAEKEQLEKQIEKEQVSRLDLKTRLSVLRERDTHPVEEVPDEKDEEERDTQG